MYCLAYHVCTYHVHDERVAGPRYMVLTWVSCLCTEEKDLSSCVVS